MARLSPSIKEQARALVEGPSEDATWDDVLYELAVRRSIEVGLADAEAGRVTEVREVRRTFRLSE